MFLSVYILCFLTHWTLQQIKVKGIYYCPIEIIKGTVSMSHKIKGDSSGELPVYITISFTKIMINILS